MKYVSWWYSTSTSTWDARRTAAIVSSSTWQTESAICCTHIIIICLIKMLFNVVTTYSVLHPVRLWVRHLAEETPAIVSLSAWQHILCYAYLLLLEHGALRHKRRRSWRWRWCRWRSWWWCHWRTHTLVSCRKTRVSGYCPEDSTTIAYPAGTFAS